MLKSYIFSKSNINLKQRFLPFIILTLLSLSTTIILAQNSINKSPYLQLLDLQIEKNYVPRQMNMGIDEITINIPMLYVQLLGSAMRNQKSYLKQNPKSLEKFENLHKEIISIIPQIANLYNSTNSSKTGYEYNDATTLEDYYYRALEGIFSQNFKQHYKEQSGKDITQVNIPFILKPTEPNYIKEAKKDDAIILLGEEVLKSSPHELQGPSITGLKCPLKSDKNLKIDTNENPDDRTYLSCDYFEDGLLKEQRPYVDGYKHGEYFGFWQWEDTPYHLNERGYYKNGNKNDIWDDYQYWPYLKISLLYRRFKYDNGVKVFKEEYKVTDSHQSVYLSTRNLYIKGKWSDYTWFYENGKRRKHSKVSDRTYVKFECWDENGNSMPCD